MTISAIAFVVIMLAALLAGAAIGVGAYLLIVGRAAKEKLALITAMIAGRGDTSIPEVRAALLDLIIGEVESG
jgi:hypothetical protein